MKIIKFCKLPFDNNMRILFITVFSLISTSLFSQSFNTQGTDFWVAFGQNAINVTPNRGSFTEGIYTNDYYPIELKIRLVASEATDVTFTFSETNGNMGIGTINLSAGTIRDISLDSVQKLAVYSNRPLSRAYNLYADGTTSKSLRIQSSKPISAYAINYGSRTSDATNLFPAQHLGTAYYHVSYPSDNQTATTYADSRYDGFLVVATENNTTVARNGSTVATLSRAGDVYYYYNRGDLTGNYITTSKPVAYFTSNTGTRVPQTYWATEMLYQQMLPVNTWGTKFLVPSTNRTYDIVRVVASIDATTVTFNGGTRRSGGTVTGANTVSLNKGQYLELQIQNTGNGSYISSGNKPVAVCAYLVGNQYAGEPGNSSTLDGDPGLAWVPPVEQSITSTVVSPFYMRYAPNHYALIVVPSGSTALTTAMKGTSTSIPLTGTWKTNSGYSFLAVDLSADVDASYTFSNPDGLTVLLYGYGGSESYYYLAGAAARTLNPHFLVNDEHFQDIYGNVYCDRTFNFEAVIYSRLAGSGNEGFAPQSLRWWIKKGSGNFIEETSVSDIRIWNKALTPDTYQVMMVVRNLNNLLDTCVTTFVVSDGPSPSFTAAPEYSCVGELQTYTTQAGMQDYEWTISGTSGIDYTIASGGNATSNTTVIRWLTSGIRNVSVTYKDVGGCPGVSPATVAVTVSTAPVPTFTSTNDALCVNVEGTYVTQPGMSNYTWNISGVSGTDYTITAGSITSNSITLKWLSSGNKTISVNYINSGGCTAASPASTNTVVSALPTPIFILAPTRPFIGDISEYSTQTGMTDYAWAISGTAGVDYEIVSGGGVTSNTISIRWLKAGTITVSVHYRNVDGCLSETPGSANVRVGSYDILYVKDYTHPETANSIAGDGGSWESAMDNFADALNMAYNYPGCITEIWVAEGTYYPKYNAGSGLADNSRDRAFLIPDGISIYGGFPASAETSSNYDKDDISHRNWSEWETILSGDLGTQGNIADNAYHVIISGSYTENSVLDGLTVTGGNANSEDWITIYTGDMIYRNLGGGIYIANSSVKLYNMRISGNKAYELSGGWSNPAGLGGGLYILQFDNYPTLINSAVTGNLAYQGSGIYINNASTASDILFTNITIAGNRAGSGYGGAILSSGSTSSFKNSIIWNNGDSTINYTSSQKLNFINCLVEGSNGSENWNENVGTDGGNNIDKDPLFVGEEDISSAPTLVGNYRLSICSPAIDKGDKTFAELSGINNDLGGLPRIYNDIQIDIGTYEYQGEPCYTLLGTVFPFVYNATPEFDTLFIYRAELHAVPPVGTFDPVADIINGTPLYESKVINYDGTVFVPGTPRNPGPIGSQNNPGLPIEWSFIGKTQGTVDTTSVLRRELPSLAVGLFMFENVVAGDYILMISREGYLTRFAKITVASDMVLGHRELMPGDLNGDFLINSHDVSVLISKMSSYGSNRYGAKYDLNGDGAINQIDISLLNFYQSASMEMYRETLDWILGY